MNKKNLPISPWAYFGYNILFNIPLLGFIFLIIYSFDESNINRRNYARSFFCVYALILILMVIIAVSGSSAIIINELIKYLD